MEFIDGFNNFVKWCNCNEGFVSAVLSVLTLMTSIIAIWISVRLAYIPYKKRIFINPVFDIKENKYELSLTIANSGNKLIGISYVTVYYKNEYIGDNCEQKFIEPSKTNEYFIELNLNAENVKFDKKRKVKIVVDDTEKKEYKFKVNLALG